MSRPLLISSQSDYLIQVFDRTSDYLMTNSADSDQKPTDLDLHCLLRQGMLCSAREGLIYHTFISLVRGQSMPVIFGTLSANSDDKLIIYTVEH